MRYIFGREFAKQTKRDKLFDVVNYSCLTLLLLVVMYPLYFIIIASFSAPNEVAAGNVSFFPIGFTVKGYREIFKFSKIWTGYRNSIMYMCV